jgi:hypothetical protein
MAWSSRDRQPLRIPKTAESGNLDLLGSRIFRQLPTTWPSSGVTEKRLAEMLGLIAAQPQ